MKLEAAVLPELDNNTLALCVGCGVGCFCAADEDKAIKPSIESGDVAAITSAAFGCDGTHCLNFMVARGVGSFQRLMQTPASYSTAVSSPGSGRTSSGARCSTSATSSVLSL